MTGAAITLTADMLKPITDTVTANVPVVVGVGIALMAIMIGVSLIPKVVFKFF